MHDHHEGTEPWTRERVEAFIEESGIDGAAIKRIADAWMIDQECARDAGRESHAESVYYGEW